MEVGVAVAPPPSTAVDSNCSSPYMTPPSSPQCFGNLFYSTPNSPTRVSTSLNQLNNFTSTHSSSSSSIPFQWEQQPGVPKDDDFEFNFSGQHEPPSLSAADELFDGGKIKPLKPPPRLHSGEGITSPRSPKRGKKIFSPRHNQKRDNDSDPFEMALEETRRREEEQQRRGRERVSSSSSGRKGTRSLSPFRVSDIMYETEDKVVSSTTSNTKSSSSWSKIAQFFPGRVGSEIKNYWLWHTIFNQIPGASESSYSNLDHNVQVQEQSRCSLSTEILPAISENKEKTHGHGNPEKQSAGKRKAVEFNVSSDNNLECSWPLLSESSDDKDKESYSGSENFSGPS